MTEKNRHYEYSVNQVPPPWHLIISSFQHIILMVMSLNLPIFLAGQISEGSDLAASLIAFSMIASGFGSIIQSVGIPFIGSGYLCPNLCGPSYLSVSLSAAWAGGLPLVRGMIVLAGLVEMSIAPVIHRLKNVFPPFIVGLVMAMVGVSVIKASVASFFGLEFRGDAIRVADIFIGTFSIMVMVLANLWGKGVIKMYCLLVGMLAGWIMAVIFVPEYWNNILSIKADTFFAVPSIGSEYMGISFDPGMALSFVVISITATLKSFGNLMVAQKISEPELEKPNFLKIKKGLLADGLATALAGVMGGMAVDTSSSNIGLAGATKVVSRWIGVSAGVLFIILAFFPRFVSLLSMMPKPVMGATIMFAGSFMICTGLKEMFSKGWDQRKTFVVGIALFFGLSTAFMPDLYARAPQFIQVFCTDPLPTTIIIAVVLNQIFNLDVLMTRIKEG